MDPTGQQGNGDTAYPPPAYSPTQYPPDGGMDTSYDPNAPPEDLTKEMEANMEEPDDEFSKPAAHRGEGDCAPPAYDMVPEYPDAPPPDYFAALAASPEAAALYDEPLIEGIPTPVSAAPVSDSAPPEVQQQQVPTPHLFYVDFLPRVIDTDHEGRPSKFDSFRSLMGYVNFWLGNNPGYRVFRIESVERKLSDKDATLETDSTVYHQPVYGTCLYVRGLRMWLLTATPGCQQPVQQVGYVNIVPKEYHRQSYVMIRRHGMWIQQPHVIIRFEDLDKTLERFNATQRVHPLPGKVLTVETLSIRYHHGWTFVDYDPDQSFWNDRNRSCKSYLNILRCFFIQGPPTSELIGLQDFIPNIVKELPQGATFAPYDPTFDRAAQWISTYNNKAMNVTNIQTISVKVDRGCRRGLQQSSRTYVVNSRDSIFDEGGQTQYVKVIRIGYTVFPHGCADPGNVTAGSVTTTKLFVPVRLDARTAEPLSVTVQRINAWLQLTGARLIGVDTLKFEFFAQVARLRCEEVSNKVDHSRGHYWMTTLRLYFDGPFVEPPPHLLPAALDYEKQMSGSCCNLM